MTLLTLKGLIGMTILPAVRAGLDRNYDPMKNIFSGVILKTVKTYGGE